MHFDTVPFTFAPTRSLLRAAALLAAPLLLAATGGCPTPPPAGNNGNSNSASNANENINANANTNANANANANTNTNTNQNANSNSLPRVKVRVSDLSTVEGAKVRVTARIGDTVLADSGETTVSPGQTQSFDIECVTNFGAVYRLTVESASAASAIQPTFQDTPQSFVGCGGTLSFDVVVGNNSQWASQINCTLPCIEP